MVIDRNEIRTNPGMHLIEGPYGSTRVSQLPGNLECLQTKREPVLQVSFIVHLTPNKFANCITCNQIRHEENL